MPVLMSGNGPYLVKEASWVASGVAGWPCRAAGISWDGAESWGKGQRIY